MTTVLPQKIILKSATTIRIVICLINEIKDFTLSYSLHNSSPLLSASGWKRKSENMQKNNLRL